MNTIVKLALELSKATEWEMRGDLQTHRTTLLVWGLSEKEAMKLQLIADSAVPAPHRYEIVCMGSREADGNE